MAIIPLSKVTLFGRASDKTAALEFIQGLGVIHLVPLRSPQSTCTSTDIRAKAALKYLLNSQHLRRPITKVDGSFDAERLVDEIFTNKDHIIQLEEQAEQLRARIVHLTPWGHFDFLPEDEMDGLHMWFYILPHHKLRQLELREDLNWEIVARDSRHAYVVVLAEQEPQDMPEPRTHAGKRGLAHLERALETTEISLEEAQANRIALTRWRHLLTKRLARLDDRAALCGAANETFDDGEIFAVQGWAPRNRTSEIERFTTESGLAVLIEKVGPGEEPPTLLSNPERISGGEEVVKFYSVPGYGTVDPSNVLFFSFLLFFAMIMSDAGYALVLGVILLLFWRKLTASPTGKRVGIMVASIVGVSFLWGILAGSYFGVSPPDWSDVVTATTEGDSFGPLTLAAARLRLFDIASQDYQWPMMGLAIGIGISHVSLANLMVAWRYRNSLRALPPLGWTIMLAGAGCFATAFASNVSIFNSLGILMLATGALMVVLFSSNAPLPPKHWTDIVKRLIHGLMAITNVSKAFGDVLSYLRLFALGLASASLAITFNQLAGDARDSMGGIGILVALIILLLGHAINFTLGIVSGVVHGLRLNVIEFFNWSVSDEGYPFRAFHKTEVEEWTRS